METLDFTKTPEFRAKVAALMTPDGYAREKLDFTLHPVQAAVLKAVFKKESRVSFRCSNNVGKTSRVAVSAILYAIDMLNAQVISTAGVWMQVAEQLIPQLKAHEHKFPSWRFLDDAIKVGNVNRYVAFSTRDEGFAQGFHRDEGRPLLAIIDEAAAVSDAIYNGVEDRCDPTHLLVMGSPLDPAGRFYDIETKLSKFYQHFHLNQSMCLTRDGYWIEPESLARKIAKWGREHPFIQSNVFGEFASKVENALLSLKEFENCINNPPMFQKGERHAFIDVAGGGDKNIFAVRQGNKCWFEKKWRDSSEMAAIGEIIAIFKKLSGSIGLLQEEVSIDAGGLGKPIADRLREMGYTFNRFLGQQAPRFDEEYANVIAETWGEGAKRIKRCEVIIPNDDDLRMQLLTRTIKRQSAGKFLLESKEDLAKRGISSPDEADACWTAGTMIRTLTGDRPIETISIGDMVLTPFGFSEVVATHMTHNKDVISIGPLTGTPNHKIFVIGVGWKRMDAILLTDRIESVTIQPLWNMLNSLFTRVENIAFKHLVDTIKTKTGTAAKRDFFIESSGKSNVELFRMVFTSIIKTAIGQITESKTWNWLRLGSIQFSMRLKDSKTLNTREEIDSIWTRLSKRLLLGTNPMLEACGTNSMALYVGNPEKTISLNRSVQNAVKNLKRQPLSTSFAQSDAGSANLIGRKRLSVHALVAASRSLLTSIVQPQAAPKNVSGLLGKRTVYNLTLKEENVYYANGLLVQNCLGCIAPAPKMESFNLGQQNIPAWANDADEVMTTHSPDGRRFC